MGISFMGQIQNKVAEHAREILPGLLPPGHRNLIGRLNRDLHTGPVYLQVYPEWPRQEVECCFGDEGAYQFDFYGALTELQGYIDEAEIGDWFYDEDEYWSRTEPQGYWQNDETGETSEEIPDGVDEIVIYVEDDDDAESNQWVYIEALPYYRIQEKALIQAYVGAELFRHF